jgi:hypothetical protein
MVIRVAPSGSVSCEISDFRIVVDPGPRERGSLVLKTSATLPFEISSPETIDRPGEYDIAGIKVKGLEIETESDTKVIKTSYLVEADGVNLCFLDGLVKEPDDAFLEKLGEVDVLFITADKGSLEPKKLGAVVKEIEPKIVVAVNEMAAENLTDGLGKKPEIADRLVVKSKDFETEEGTKFLWIKEK